ncbi:MAG: TetR/AcrR family transcriptional regulator [Spirochaetaceae bacterium]
MNETKKNITIQALKFFTENDYDRASLNSIAEALNVTKGAIYHYFKNKDGLFEECLNFINTSMESFFDSMLPENPNVESMLKTFLNYINADEMLEKICGIKIHFDSITFTSLMYSGMKKFPDMQVKFKESYVQMLDMLEGMIIKEQAEGFIKTDIHPRLLALEITTMAEGGMLMTGFYSDKDNELMKTFADDLWNRIKV